MTEAPVRFPIPMGSQGSGVIVAIGSEVRSFDIGDEVYGSSPWVGFAAEYVNVPEQYLLRKPQSISFIEAAALSADVVEAYRMIRRGLELAGWENLHGKTVCIPRAFSAEGYMQSQIAKKVFGAGHIISTHPGEHVRLVEMMGKPGKMKKVGDLMAPIFDRVINTSRHKIRDVIPAGSVDFALEDFKWDRKDFKSILKPGSVLISANGVPRKETAKKLREPGKFGWLHDLKADGAQLVYKWKFRGTGIQFDKFMDTGYSMDKADRRDDLISAGHLIEYGVVKTMVKCAEFEDIESVRKELEKVHNGRKSVGKFVIRMVK